MDGAKALASRLQGTILGQCLKEVIGLVDLGSLQREIVGLVEGEVGLVTLDKVKPGDVAEQEGLTFLATIGLGTDLVSRKHVFDDLSFDLGNDALGIVDARSVIHGAVLIQRDADDIQGRSRIRRGRDDPVGIVVVGIQESIDEGGFADLVGTDEIDILACTILVDLA